MEELLKQKIELFFDKYPVKKFKAGDIIINSGEQPQYIYYIVRGHVKQSDVSKRGTELVLNTYRPPSFFPISAGVPHLQNIYRFQAVDDTLVRRAPANDVLAWLKHEPDVMYDLLIRLQSGLYGLLRRLSQAMAGTAQEKIVFELLLNGERFGHVVDNGFVLNLSVKELASRSGMARETASRELSHLKDQDLISIKGGTITVYNKQALTDLL